ncbi:MAG: hypothetical protein ACJ78Q_09255 [Chloroflexia bacterium]
MDDLSSWVLPVLAVGVLVVVTLVFALFIGRWIDAQSNSVVDEPRKERRSRRRDEEEL